MRRSVLRPGIVLGLAAVLSVSPLAAVDRVDTVDPAIVPEVDPRMPVFDDQVWVIGDEILVVPVDRGDSVSIRFPVGELDVEAAEIDEVRTELRIDCRKISEARCEKYRSKLRLEPSLRDGVVEVRLVGLPKWKLRRLQLDGRIEFPRWAPLAVRVGVGDVDIRSGDQDLTVRMGIGDLTVYAPQELVGSVVGRTGIGDASLRAETFLEGKRKKLVGAKFDWHEGQGEVDIAVGLKIGDARVVLE